MRNATLSMTAALPLLLAALAGCGGKHPGSYAVEAAGSKQESGALAEADALWAQRVELDKLKAALTKYEEALAADPTSRPALEHLVRGYYFWGDAFEDDKATKIELWGKAIAYGAQCMGLNGEIASRIAAGEKERDAVAAATKADVPCIYWTASALGKWGKAQSLSTTLKHLPTVKAYISKVEELDPQFWYYGPARYWGAYYAALPSFAGRDFVKSAEYLQSSVTGAPHYLGTRVIRAEFLAIGTDDVALFDEDIKYVLEADISGWPDILPENTREQEKARKLLAERQEKFSKADPATAPVITAKGPAAPAPAKAEPAPAPEAAPAAAEEPAPATEPAPEAAPEPTTQGE